MKPALWEKLIVPGGPMSPSGWAEPNLALTYTKWIMRTAKSIKYLKPQCSETTIPCAHALNLNVDPQSVDKKVDQ